VGDSIGFVAAFAAGLLSFLSPCVLPILPGYLSFMTGLTTTELSAGERRASIVLIPSVLFVLGFSTVFVALGASASVLGSVLVEYRSAITIVAGVFVFAFGLLLTGVIRVPWLYGEARVDLEKTRRFGRGASYVMGMAFAAGWTPCVGPILGTILALAASSGGVVHGAALLLAYSLGLGVPFIATALLFGQLKGVLRWLNRHALIVNRVAGAILMVVGILIVTGRFTALAGWLAGVLPAIEL
jgi:cytochrome c-type biogenesis protein